MAQITSGALIVLALGSVSLDTGDFFSLVQRCVEDAGITSSAQRLSASSEFSRVLYTSLDTGKMCSTPFGIIGILTKSNLNSRLNFLLCSTPFGIIGILTLRKRMSVGAGGCAQRLSASSEFSHLLSSSGQRTFTGAQRLSASSEFSRIQLVLGLRSFPLCSTPFGIIGILTHLFPTITPELFVLNAFRHHRNSHTRTTRLFRAR